MNNIWRTLTFILIGLLIGYLLGRFEFTIQFKNNAETAGKSTTVAAEEEKEEEPTRVTDVSIDDDPFLGDENAPVVIVEFSDYQCPFSKKFYTKYFSSIKEDFIDTGKVKYVFRDFPLPNLHPNAASAANAAECADDQGKYWEMHDLLFDKQDEWGKASNINEALLTYAQEVGLNTAQFSECINSQKYKDEIIKDMQDGDSYGVIGTPTISINGVLSRGVPQNYSQLKQYIENQLSS